MRRALILVALVLAGCGGGVEPSTPCVLYGTGVVHDAAPPPGGPQVGVNSPIGYATGSTVAVQGQCPL